MFPSAAVIKCHKLGGLEQQTFFLSSGGQKSAVQMLSARLVPSGGSEGGPALCLSPNFWWLLAVFGISWFVGTAVQSLPLFSCDILCVSLSTFSFHNDISHWIRA